MGIRARCAKAAERLTTIAHAHSDAPLALVALFLRWLGSVRTGFLRLATLGRVPFPSTVERVLTVRDHHSSTQGGSIAEKFAKNPSFLLTLSPNE